MKSTWSKVVSAITGMAMIVAGAWYADDRYAKAQELMEAKVEIASSFKKLGKRLDQKIKADEIQYLRRQLWSIQGKTGKVDCGKLKQVCVELQVKIRDKRDTPAR